MKLGVGDQVVTKTSLVFWDGIFSKHELPEGIIGEIINTTPNPYGFRVVFDYPGFRDNYVYVILEEEILPIEQDKTPGVDASALKSILQGM